LEAFAKITPGMSFLKFIKRSVLKIKKIVSYCGKIEQKWSILEDSADFPQIPRRFPANSPP
jgi:hypothetical protein